MQKSLRKTGRCGPVRQNIIGETTVERSYRGMPIDFTVRFHIDPLSFESLRALEEVRIQPGGAGGSGKRNDCLDASLHTRRECLRLQRSKMPQTSQTNSTKGQNLPTKRGDNIF